MLARERRMQHPALRRLPPARRRRSLRFETCNRLPAFLNYQVEAVREHRVYRKASFDQDGRWGAGTPLLGKGKTPPGFFAGARLFRGERPSFASSRVLVKTAAETIETLRQLVGHH